MIFFDRLDFHNDYLTKTLIILRSIKKHFFSFVLSSSFLALDIDSMFRLGNLKRNDFENGSSGKLQTIQVKNFETVDFKRFKLGTSK
ncbi:unnamed protein product [Rhizophagus irregularis]|nr:unnamed protein product [Rhizophagus irregularis]CAB5302840.1 unnamed protein product [Rhizophagus irregularis]